jgi:hypothetical protein
MCAFAAREIRSSADRSRTTVNAQGCALSAFGAHGRFDQTADRRLVDRRAGIFANRPAVEDRLKRQHVALLARAGSDDKAFFDPLH